jgi:hypothetical protein
VNRRSVATYGAVVLVASVVGALVVVSPTVAVVTTVLFVILAVARGLVARLTYVAILTVLALPTGWGVERLLRTEVGIGSISSPVQVVLPILCSILIGLSIGTSRTVSGSNPFRHSDDRFLWGVAAFAASSFLPLMTGLIDRQPFGLIYRDLRFVLMYIFAVALVYAIRAGVVTRKAIVLAAMSGLTIYAIFVVVVYFDQAGWRQIIYAGAAGWEASTRVGFGTTSLLVLSVPFLLAVASARDSGWRVPVPAFYAMAMLMLAAVAISQSRSTIAACGVATLATLLMPIRKDSAPSGIGRGRLLVALAIVGLIAAVVLIATPAGMSLVEALEQRGLVTLQGASTRTRIYTFQVALGGIGAGDMIVGRGFGSLLDVVSSSGGYFGSSLFIDNAALTALLKGGVPYLAGLGAMFGTFWTQVREARNRSRGAEHVLWGSIASSLPWFLVITTMASAHALNSPAVAVGVAVVGALASTVVDDEDEMRSPDGA